jgi:hypothetical protein
MRSLPLLKASVEGGDPNSRPLVFFTEMIDFHSFLPEDPKEAKRIFNTLPAEQQLEIVLKTRGQERVHYLLLSEHPEELVQRLPELEVFLTIKEVGEKDSLDLISLTTAGQFQYLLDLEFWKKDGLNSEKILHWMELLLESGEEKVIQFIHTSDLEFIELLLKKFLKVTTADGEPIETSDRIPGFTLDQYYFIHFKEKAAWAVFVPFLQILYRIDEEGYRRLMESLIVELDSEMEEVGYRLRNARMADYGFPDFEEALEIYRFVNPDSLIPERGPSVSRIPGGTERISPPFYLTFQGEGSFLSSVLSRIDDPEEQNRIKIELAALSNKAMVAEPIDLFEIDEMKKVTQKVFHYLNLGLQYVSGEEEVKAREALHSFPLQKIFQCGVGATLLLRSKAESILKEPWFSGDRENLTFLDPPHLEKFEGVLRKRPVLYRDGIPEDFKSLQDFRETKTLLEMVEAATRFLGEKLHVYPKRLKELDPEVTLSTIFLTALANQDLKATFQFEPIERGQLKNLFSRIFERDEQGKGVIRMEIKNGLKNALCSMEADENRRIHLLAFKDFCLDLFEEEFGRVPPEEEIDPRFVKCLLIQK